MAAEVNPSGQLTLEILTKLDLVDKEVKHDTMDLVRGRKKKLKPDTVSFEIEAYRNEISLRPNATV